MHFNVTVLHKGKRYVKKITADTPAQARLQASGDGEKILNVKTSKIPSRSEKKFPLALFIQELAALLEAGLMVVEAIEALHESSHDKEYQLVLQIILKELYRGCQFSQALSAQPQIFTPLLINSVSSSEQTGLLAITLQRFLSYEKRMETLRKRIRNTMLYPMVVISAGVLIMFFLLGFVIPRFATVFDGMGSLTGSAKFIVWWGYLVNTHGFLLLTITSFILTSLVVAIRNQNLRNTALHLILRIPKLKKQYQISILVRFYRTLGLLLQGGTPVLGALTLAGNLLPPEYRQHIGKMLVNIQSGKSLSWTLEHHQLTTPVASRLLLVGEHSGELPGMCERIASFYDEMLERAIEAFSKVFEPLLMLVVGGLVGLVVFLLYMPIFEIAGGLS